VWQAAKASVLGPVVVVAIVLALLVAGGLLAYHGNPTAFVRFGRVFAPRIHPPPGAVVDTPQGYDGQYFWAQALDPLLLHASTLAKFTTQSFRLGRVAYPALAYVLAAGRPGAIPWTLLAVNVLVVLAITVAFSVYARRRGWSPAWGLAVGLLPGLLFATMGDLSDALAVAALLGGLMMWRRRRRGAAAGLLALAVLAREPMILGVVGVAAEGALGAWRGAGRPGVARSAVTRERIRAVLRSLWPVAAVPVLVFAGWQLYLSLRHGGSSAPPGTAFQPPFAEIVAEVRHALREPSAVRGAWDEAYLALMVVAMGIAFARLRRSVNAASIAAALFAASLLVMTFGDEWSYTRLSAPLFACLLLDGLEQRSRPALLACGAVAVLGVIVPIAIA
jgi:hypothetical protein